MAITTITELRNEIRLLEDKKASQLELIKEDFGILVESMKPSNIIKSSVNNIISSPNALRNILIAFGGIAAAYITRKNLSSTNNPFKKILVTVIQAGVASLLTVKGYDIKQKLYSFLKGIFSDRRQEQYQ